MPPIVFADNFTAGSILSLVLPAALLIAFAVWYVLTVLRMSGKTAGEVVEKVDSVVNPDPSAAAGGTPASGTSTGARAPDTR